jgi:GNAT superfamily N-acetyltransferase
MLGRLSLDDQLRLIAAMNTIHALLGDNAETAAPDAPAVDSRYTLRPQRPGDFGWVVKRHAELYAQEHGWIETFEGVCAQIVADFANKNDPKRERCWIAEMNGETIGCVFLAADSDTVARIRLLLVDPKARGLGLGARLVEECIGFARATSYEKITLWTHSVLTAARHIYQKAGFTLSRSEERVSWSKPVVSEHWDLEL